MGVVEDVRKVLQDLVTPEMRALAAELKAMREETSRRFDDLRVEMDRRFQDTRTDIAELRGEMRAQAEASRNETKAAVSYIVSQLHMDERLGRLEQENQRRKQTLPDNQ